MPGTLKIILKILIAASVNPGKAAIETSTEPYMELFHENLPV